MTIEELLGYDIAALEKMSDAELESHLKPYFSVTRPTSVKALASSVRMKKGNNVFEANKLLNQIKALHNQSLK